MKKTVFWLVGLVVALNLVISCMCLRSGTGSSAVTLFNGRDLAGWESVSADPSVAQEQVWRVADGILICTGEPMGYLQTQRHYTNFTLEVEYRWAPGKEPGNSGVFSRINGPPRPLPRCIETQLKHGDAGDLYGFHGLKISGAPDRFKEIPNHQLGGDISAVKRMAGNEKSPGEWNQVKIEARGSSITVTINGKKVNEATEPVIHSGPVALQSEGGEVHFRNIRLTPRAGI